MQDTEAAMENAPDPEQPVQLPEALMLHILSLLPAAQQAYTARRVCKAACARLRHMTTISATSADLPLAALQEMFLHNATSMYKQWHLAAARAACGDLQGLQWLHSSGCAWDGARPALPLGPVGLHWRSCQRPLGGAGVGKTGRLQV
ncbi:hypothetical protein OEZ85_008323 [Tetradesmus obliquus]|uniref:F-box domain-containing protein n=1 Tax=Tetradesmus obliquus TaxID=3088 RepID=A0ABY8TII2_TETOB|nr:hypothetical protein OEZ85_008323 [Tetradesmus obliquus]